jgi:hypothetical protein
MKHLISVILMMFCLISGGTQSYARGVDPKADAQAIASMRKKMDEIRKYRSTVALVLSGGGAKGAAHV